MTLSNDLHLQEEIKYTKCVLSLLFGKIFELVKFDADADAGADAGRKLGRAWSVKQLPYYLTLNI